MSQGGYDEDAKGINYLEVRARAKQLFPKTRGASEDPTAKQSQIGGTHYKDMVIQPFEYIHKNNLGYLEGTAVKYLSRWRNKGGIEDLEKAIHAIQYLIELEKGGSA